jgi:hypothetical protein
MNSNSSKRNGQDTVLNALAIPTFSRQHDHLLAWRSLAVPSLDSHKIIVYRSAPNEGALIWLHQGTHVGG